MLRNGAKQIKTLFLKDGARYMLQTAKHTGNDRESGLNKTLKKRQRDMQYTAQKIAKKFVRVKLRGAKLMLT